MRHGQKEWEAIKCRGNWCTSYHISNKRTYRKEDDSDASDRSIWKLSLLSDVASFLGYGLVNFE